MPLDAKYRERKIQDMTTRLESLYETMMDLEGLIKDAQLRKNAIEEDVMTMENIYRLLLSFSQIYDMVVEAASVVLLVFCRSDEDIAVPFIREVPDIRNGYVHAFVFRALYKGGEAVVVSSDIDELPMIFAAYSFQIVDVLCLEGLIVIAGVTSGREFIAEIFFEFCNFSHFV